MSYKEKQVIYVSQNSFTNYIPAKSLDFFFVMITCKTVSQATVAKFKCNNNILQKFKTGR